jgi:hypothetical protein
MDRIGYKELTTYLYVFSPIFFCFTKSTEPTVYEYDLSFIFIFIIINNYISLKIKGNLIQDILTL